MVEAGYVVEGERAKNAELNAHAAKSVEYEQAEEAEASAETRSPVEVGGALSALIDAVVAVISLAEDVDAARQALLRDGFAEEDISIFPPRSAEGFALGAFLEES